MKLNASPAPDASAGCGGSRKAPTRRGAVSGKAEQDFRAAREEVDVNLEETRREFERMGLEADKRFEKVRAEIAQAEQAHRDEAAGRS